MLKLTTRVVQGKRFKTAYCVTSVTVHFVTGNQANSTANQTKVKQSHGLAI